MGRTTRGTNSRPSGRARRLWGHAWLPLLLVALVVVLGPRINGFLLGVLLLCVALATTWLRDVRRSRADTPRKPGTPGDSGLPPAG